MPRSTTDAGIPPEQLPVPATTERPLNVLVCGATGYVGGRLIPNLLQRGHAVRGLARRPAKLEGRSFAGHESFAAIGGDVLQPETITAAMGGIDVVYYLVHSMGGANGHDFADRDVAGARKVALAAEAAGVQRIVYLSGLGREDDTLSAHLRSRHDTGDALRSAAVPVTELRAAIIVGSGSASFQIIRDLVHRLPLMITPRWVESRVEPIAIRDVVRYLGDVLDEPRTIGETLEIGSGDVLRYRDLMEVCAEVMGRTIHVLPVPVLSPAVSSWWLHLVTSIDASIARPLVEGLRNDVVCDDTRIREWIPFELSDYRTSVRRALARTTNPDGERESWWSDAERGVVREPRAVHLARTTHGSTDSTRRTPEYRDYRTFDTPLDSEQVFARLMLIGGPNGYGGDRIMWRARAVLDRLVGGSGFRRGRPRGVQLFEGDAVDWWRVDHVRRPDLLTLRGEFLTPGETRIDFRVERLANGGSRLHQLATLQHSSAWSTLYWRSIAPLHDRVFNALGHWLVDVERNVPCLPHGPIEAPGPRLRAVHVAGVQ